MERKYTPTIGLEIHAELATHTKMFCGCLNDAEEKRPNVNICPVCMAHPGTLPVINREAVHKVLQVGVALGGTLPDATWFDRKNYFYPDIPKGYQISQYEDPLVRGGELAGVAITRVHLEEDTARSTHTAVGSLVDFNRAGVALMELVTEPVIHDAETAGMFARELQLLLRYLGASEANMEMGQMRVEANISVAKETPSKAKESPLQLGTKVEVKNLNSFRSVERAIAYEVERQIALIESGGEVVQETRGWDEGKQMTFSQRKKESSHDYRYFPEPDLPRLRLSNIQEFSLDVLKVQLPELPWERRKRYLELGLRSEDAEVFIQDQFLRAMFEGTTKLAGNDMEVIRLVGNYIISDIVRLARSKEIQGEILNFKTEGFLRLMCMVKDKKVSSRGAKDVLEEIYTRGGDPESIAKEKGLFQQSDQSALTAIAQKVVDTNPNVAAEYKAGKTTALQFLIGQGMKESKGSANPTELKKIFEGLLS